MFYKRSVWALVALAMALVAATLFVVKEAPYTRNFWLEFALLMAVLAVAGWQGVRIVDHPGSSLPFPLAGLRLTLRYAAFVLLMSIPVFFGLDVKFKYYALAHGFGLGLWLAALIVLRMGTHAVDEQDASDRLRTNARHGHSESEQPNS